jgi:hypothetical protein
VIFPRTSTKIIAETTAEQGFQAKRHFIKALYPLGKVSDLTVIYHSKLTNQYLKTHFMQQINLESQSIASIGEAISPELGAQMIRQYQELHPADTHNYLIGRDILDRILEQPGCVGIKFYNAINESGEKTLVYVGVNSNSESIIAISVINKNGKIDLDNGIVADRIKTGSNSIDSDNDGWWTVD